MTHNMQVLEERLNSSRYDPVIWEDVKPLEERMDELEKLLNDLISAIIDADDLRELKNKVGGMGI